MHLQRLFWSSVAIFLAATGIATAAERPELYAFPFKTEVGTAGDYVATRIGEDFVLGGEISGDVTLTGTELFRVTLSNATVSGTLTLVGDAQLWLIGENSITATAASAGLTIGGPGALRASAPGGKKIGVISAADLTLAGADTTLTIADPTAKNACGVSLSGNYVQLAGALSIVGESDDVKQNGIFLSKKKTTAAISGGTLAVTLADEKSVGLALDKDTCATADLETWLKTSDNAETYAYASQITAAPSFAALTFSDDAQGFVVVPPDDGISVTATPVACYSLSVASPEWIAFNLVQDPASGVYYPAEETAVCFATLRFSWDW